jgi:hypothetical protein
MTAASGPLSRNPALLVHHLSFLIYCLTSHTHLLAPRFHAHALFPFSSSAGRFRHNSLLKLNKLRSLVQRQSFCLHEYITFPSLAAAGYQRDSLPSCIFFVGPDKMERWGLHYPQLDTRSHFNMTLNVSAAREEPWTAENKTRAVIASLQLAQVQTIRTMHLTLGAFSLALTLLTVHRIMSDARRAAAVQVPLRKEYVVLCQWKQRRLKVLDDSAPSETSIPPRHSHSYWLAVRLYNKLSL